VASSLLLPGRPEWPALGSAMAAPSSQHQQRGRCARLGTTQPLPGPRRPARLPPPGARPARLRERALVAARAVLTFEAPLAGTHLVWAVREGPWGPIRSGGSRWSRSLPGGGPSGGPSGGPPPRGGPPGGGHPVDPRWTFRPPGPPPSECRDTAKRLSLESGGPVDPLYRSLGRESSLLCLCDISY